MITLSDAEAELAREALYLHWPNLRSGQCFAAKRLLARIEKNRVMLGDKVFFLKLALGSDATAPVRKVAKERKELRKAFGVTRLARGVGPAQPKPKPYAPTLNEYNGLEGWQKAYLREVIDEEILKAKASHPAWNMGIKREAKVGKDKKVHVVKTGGRRRAVIVTRYSSRQVDESESVDVLGGKMPIDRLVHADILRDDREEWVHRIARWEPAPPEGGRVTIEVFEITR